MCAVVERLLGSPVEVSGGPGLVFGGRKAGIESASTDDL